MYQLNNFGVEVLGHNVVNVGPQEYSLPNDSEYSLLLYNGHTVPADAVVKIDEENIGTWRILPDSTITIERGKVDRKFLFVSESSYQAAEGGVVSGRYENGLITVTFYPKQEHYTKLSRFPRNVSIQSSYSESPRSFSRRESISSRSVSERTSSPRALASRGSYSTSPRGSSTSSRGLVRQSRGATILGGFSNQRFGETSALEESEIDVKNITEITVRLLARSNNVYTE